MKNITTFLTVSVSSYGSGYGDGSGFSDGYGSGYGDGSGNGSGSDFGSGVGSGYGAGDGDDDGSGFGSGSSFGSGYGDGSGFDYGSGYSWGYDFNKNIKSINNYQVYYIDNISTVITNVVKNIAKGYILRSDLTLEPCYVAKVRNYFAHGETIQEALNCANNKIYAHIDTDEVIELFLEKFNMDEKYPAKDFYIWHNRLTGSCAMGRAHFVKEHNIDLEHDKFTVKEFIELTKNDYGKEIIKQLENKVEIFNYMRQCPQLSDFDLWRYRR